MGYLDGTGLGQVWDKAVKNFAAKEKTYTKTETDEAINLAVGQAVAGIYKVKGSIAFADLPVTGMREGYVYNITDAFTADDTFVESERGNQYPAGTNVSYTEAGWDALAGVYDFTDFLKISDVKSITKAEIDAICTMPEA